MKRQNLKMERKYLTKLTFSYFSDRAREMIKTYILGLKSSGMDESAVLAGNGTFFDKKHHSR